MTSKTFAQVDTKGNVQCIMQTEIVGFDINSGYFDVERQIYYVTPPEGVEPPLIFDSWKWINGVWQEVGKRPEPFYVFDSEAMQWIDPRSIDELKQAKWEAIKQQRDLAEFSGFEYQGHIFDSDAISQQRIQGAVQLALLAASTNEPYSVEWTLQNNNTLLLDGTSIVEVGIQLGRHINWCHSTARELRQAIETATTKEAVNALKWPENV